MPAARSSGRGTVWPTTTASRSAKSMPKGGCTLIPSPAWKTATRSSACETSTPSPRLAPTGEWSGTGLLGARAPGVQTRGQIVGVRNHEPEILENGNMLLALRRPNRFVEFNLDTQEVAWSWEHPGGGRELHTNREANRLPNGNTLGFGRRQAGRNRTERHPRLANDGPQRRQEPPQVPQGHSHRSGRQGLWGIVRHGGHTLVDDGIVAAPP